MNDRSAAIILTIALASASAIAAPPEPVPAAAPDTASTAPEAAVAQPTDVPAPPNPRHKPDPKDEAYSPNAPIVVPAALPMTTAATTAAPKARPRPKPALAAFAGPFPRAKPVGTTATPVATAQAPATPQPAPALAASAAPAPTPTAAPSAPESVDPHACGDACNEVIFRSIGNCLWVQNANPHGVTFTARAGTRTITLALAGADSAKADAHKPFEPKEGTPSPVGEGAYHTRISDPFSPNSPGIAVYRARLGSEETCVKAREEITSFTASFARASASK